MCDSQLCDGVVEFMRTYPDAISCDDVIKLQILITQELIRMNLDSTLTGKLEKVVVQLQEIQEQTQELRREQEEQEKEQQAQTEQEQTEQQQEQTEQHARTLEQAIQDKKKEWMDFIFSSKDHSSTEFKEKESRLNREFDDLCELFVDQY